MLVRSRLLVQLELALPWKPLLGWVWGVEHRCALEMGKLGIQHANVLMVYLDHIYNCFVPMDSMDPENWVIVIVYTHPKTGIILTQLSQNSGVCWTPPCIQGSICLKAQVPPRWLMAQAAGSVSYTRNLGKHLGNCSYDKDGKPEATIEGVLVRRDGIIFCFGRVVPESLIKAWQAGGRTHVIGLVELYAAIVGLNTWKETFCNDRVILFTDSWPAYDVIVKGTSQASKNGATFCLLWRPSTKATLCICGRPESLPLPTHADPPSRGSISEIAFLGKINVIDPVCPV